MYLKTAVSGKLAQDVCGREVGQISDRQLSFGDDYAQDGFGQAAIQVGPETLVETVGHPDDRHLVIRVVQQMRRIGRMSAALFDQPPPPRIQADVRGTGRP